MTSYQERSEILRSLAEQAYFDAKLKKVEPQKKDVRIGGMDGQTGRYQVFHADGGFSNNGVRTFDGTPPSDRFVRGQQSPNSNAIALGYRDYVRTEFLNRGEDREVFEIIFLFLKDNKFYVGGDRTTPELVYELDDDQVTIITESLKITKTSTDIDGFKVQFITRSNDDSPYIYDFYTISDGVTNKRTFTPLEEVNFEYPIFTTFIVGSGSFAVIGYQDRKGLPPTGTIDYDALISSEINEATAEFLNLYPNGFITDTTNLEVWEGRVIDSTGGEIDLGSDIIWFDIPNGIQEIPTTEDTLAYLGYPSGSAGRTMGQRSSRVFSIGKAFESSNGSGALVEVFFSFFATTTLRPISFEPFPRMCSLFVNPENNVVNELQYDTFPSPERDLQINFTQDSFEVVSFNIDNYDIVLTPNDLALLNSEKIIRILNNTWRITSSLEQRTVSVDNPVLDQSIDNFAEDTIFRSEIIPPVGFPLDGDAEVTIIEAVTAESSSSADEVISYFGFTEDLKDFIRGVSALLD